MLSGYNAPVNTTSLISARAIPVAALHFPTCSDAEANVVRDAITAATAYAREAVCTHHLISLLHIKDQLLTRYLQVHPVDCAIDDRYKAWFWDKTAARYNRALTLFQYIDRYYQDIPRFVGAPDQKWVFCHAENAGAVTPRPVLCNADEPNEFAVVRGTV